MSSVKVFLVKPVKLDGTWHQPNESITVTKEQLLEGVLSGCFVITPDIQETIDDNEKKKVDSSENDSEESIIEALCQIDGINMEIAQKLFNIGLVHPSQIVELDPKELAKSLDIKEKLAVEIIKSSKSWIQE